MASVYRARAVQRTARAAHLPTVWLSVLCLLAVSALAACGTGERKALADLERCSSGVSVEGYRKVDSYPERASWNVAYVGNPNGDPLKLLSGHAVDVAAMDEVPAGPFVLIGKGRVAQAGSECVFFVERWGVPNGPTVVNVDQATSDNIANGTERLLLLSFVSPK
ncbi:hypothetical protein ONA91_25010 [Micromonospora sp. DR5-3]|uniref:hypothetical protein n=1 Tax=unclassified Micromonospora TaxID=2617518 RepID=UPI0011D77BFF|nr:MULTISPECIES: hypothetical protein [unclassified Micromonospora]MCW3817717.1 hypothetical protein [Micromonospora sp. DR5-3]TYC20026.1 hypothetical protein FXF52_33465 [Micromonospora sp. MP36]